MNELLFFISIVICFGLLILINKLFGKEGLYVWIAVATILANIETIKNISLFGFQDNVMLGTVSFASVFLATDILAENYGYKASKKGVYVGLFSIISFLLLMQISLLFIPSESGIFMHENLTNVFGISGAFFWVTISSVVMFFLANLLDVWLFEKIRQKTKGKMLWLRNTVATIIANSLENLLFCFLGFYLLPLIFTGMPIYDFVTAMVISGTACLLEIIISIADTPFVYLAKRFKNKDVNKKV